MSGFDFEKFHEEGNEFRGVFVNGKFSDWCGECDNKMMDDDGDGIYTKTVKMYNGDNKFIFSINGWEGAKKDKENDFEEWISPGKEGLDCDVAPDFNEYVIQVLGEDIILDPICWKKCTDCDGNIINLTSGGIKEPLHKNPINLIYFKQASYQARQASKPGKHTVHSSLVVGSSLVEYYNVSYSGNQRFSLPVPLALACPSFSVPVL